MLSNPRVGQLAQVHYNKRLAPHMPLHGRVGTIAVIGGCKPQPGAVQVIEGVRPRGPKNHGVLIDGVLWVVPCGNLNAVAGEGDNG